VSSSAACVAPSPVLVSLRAISTGVLIDGA
jgi:hypothetical protein